MIVEAPAKINLTLEVTGVEPNGYHTLDTLFVWLELHDTLDLRRAEKTTLEVRSDGVDTTLVTSDESNLVLRALRALEAEVQRPLPTRVELTKRIPAGGGMGGGSADAAAVLIGLRDLYELDLNLARLHLIAFDLGADVGFGLHGGFARGRGYGNNLSGQALPVDLENRQLVLLCPGFPCPTPAVYRSWDQEPLTPAEGATDRFLKAPATRRLEYVLNDLQPAAERLFPDLANLRQEMIGVGLEGVCLSGSGSTLFGFVPEHGSAEEIEGKLQGLGKVIVTKLRGHGRE